MTRGQYRVSTWRGHHVHMERMQRGRPCPHHWGLRRLGLGSKWQQATLLHDIREAQEPGRIGLEQFSNQNEAQEGQIRLITMGTGLLHHGSPVERARGACRACNPCCSSHTDGRSRHTLSEIKGTIWGGDRLWESCWQCWNR